MIWRALAIKEVLAALFKICDADMLYPVRIFTLMPSKVTELP
jgi:hypothetical protein